MRIRYQSFVDPSESAAYVERLQAYLTEIARPGTEVEVIGLSPPDKHFHRITELRLGAQAVGNALVAQDDGCDAFLFGHFQEPGLYEARAACEIPVIGLGESTLHWAAQLGRLMVLVSIDPVFEAWHWEQAERYGLRERVLGVTALGVQVADFMPAFAGDRDTYESLVSRFREEVQPFVDRGAEVVVPAGGLFALLMARERGLRVGHAVVVNPIAVALKCAEVAVDLAALCGLGPSRGPSFALPPAEALAEYRAFVNRTT